MSPRSPNAPGIAEDITSASSMTAKSSPRMRGVSGLNQFVTQQVYCQPSQTANHSTSVSTTPVSVKLCSNSWLSCVTAKT